MIHTILYNLIMANNEQEDDINAYDSKKIKKMEKDFWGFIWGDCVRKGNAGFNQAILYPKNSWGLGDGVWGRGQGPSAPGSLAQKYYLSAASIRGNRAGPLASWLPGTRRPHLQHLVKGLMPQGRVQAQLFAHLHGAAGHDRPEQHGDPAQSFQQVV